MYTLPHLAVVQSESARREARRATVRLSAQVITELRRARRPGVLRITELRGSKLLVSCPAGDYL